MPSYPHDAITVPADLDDDLIDRGPRTQPMPYIPSAQEPATMSPNSHQLRAYVVRGARIARTGAQRIIDIAHPDPLPPPDMRCSACDAADIRCPSPQACLHELVDSPYAARVSRWPALQTPAQPRPPAPPSWPGHTLTAAGDAPRGVFRWLLVSVVLVLAIIGGVSLLAGTAHAATVVGLHVSTWHDQPGYRTSTPGLYVRTSVGATLGALRNSEGRGSAYAGWTWTTDESRPISLALTLGAITGYRMAPAVPLAVPSVRMQLAPRVALRLIVLPKATEKQGATAINATIEWSL